MLVFRLEGALRSTDILDAVDNLSFLRLHFIVETNRGGDLDIDNVDQAHDSYGKNDLKEFFHFK